ncbi:helix-turn-helix domain-containing protein [uncultured Dubosiella sp.]|uniref:helix-turn-helix domain-containing protein n=1 Tax=uncultured Dubosiella sp. TaxID=1937011 RepID=UPI0025932865|nr:helix-turn-helix transcriptional regulator [uncultured Dubosiella sp.]
MLDPMEILMNARFEDVVQRDLSKRERKLRRKMKISQQEMASRSGVSLGSIKRFEQTGEISLRSLLRIAFVLGCLDDFDQVFTRKHYRSIQEVIDEQDEDAAGE